MLSGQDFQALRRERGFKSARQLAEASGITREILAQYESGARDTLTVEQVVALCSTMQISVYDLIPELIKIDPMFTQIRRIARQEILEALGEMDAATSDDLTPDDGSGRGLA